MSVTRIFQQRARSMAAVCSAIICLTLASVSSVQAGSREQAKRMHDRLAGVPPTEAILNSMATKIAGGDTAGAAAEAMANPAFYNVTLKNFAAPWTNEAQTVFVPLNDYTATVIGLIRDDADFRRVLYADVLYEGATTGACPTDGSISIPAVTATSNAHYEQLEKCGINLQTDLVPVSQTARYPGVAPAGIMTSRAASESFFIDGTNRAMFRFTFMNHMCTDLEPIKDATRSPDYVRRDVTRSPGGDSRIFLNNCVGCHAGMDGMSGAFAYYDFNETTGRVDYLTIDNQINPKYLINGDNFKTGYITTDDHWVNYWRTGVNANLGWSDTLPAGVTKDAKGITHGSGAAALGEELANSDAFASCQVKKIFKTVCLREPAASDAGQLTSMVSNFRGSGYKMKSAFADVAAYCMGI